MTPLPVVLVSIAALAWFHSRRAPLHRWIAMLLGWGASTDVIRWWFRPLFVGVPAPYTGWWRVLFHLDTALGFSWPAAIMATGLVVFGRRPWVAAWSWAAMTAAAAAAYPWLRRERLWTTYALVGVAATVLMVALAAEHTRAKRERHDAHAVILSMTAGEFVVSVLGPYRGGLVENQWSAARVIYWTVFGLIGAYYLAEAVWRRS